MTRILALSALLAAAAVLPAQEFERPGDTRVVRAYFDDPLVAARAVMSLDALESEYEKGYIVLRATEEDIETARRAGMRIVETDDYDSVALPAEPPTEAVPGTIAGFPCYRTVEKTYASARAIADRHPTLAKWRPVGRSWKMVQNAAEGYDLMVLRLTNEATTGPKPILLVTTAIHAREYTTAELGLRFAEYLVDSYETDADARWLLDHQEVHLLLQANPDGRKRAEEGVLWRKNHNTNYCSAYVPGVDLNRNFDFQWSVAGTSADQCSEVYPGPSAASEPETKAIQTYMARLFPDVRGPHDFDAAPADASGLYLDIHSHGRLILWPWGHVSEPPPNGAALQTLGRKLSFFNGYTPLQGYGFYPASGTTQDYGYGVLGRASFIYELGTTFFEDCDDFERSILDGNLKSLLYAFKVARTPYLTPAGPDVRNLSLDGRASTTGVAPGSSVRLSAIFDDTRYQDSNGAETTQTIAAGEYTVSVPHWNADAVTHPVSAADGSFDSGAEQATAVIDTSGLETGRHTVFVRARDADGNWGAVSAVFLFVQADDGSTDDTDDNDDDPGSGESGGCVVDENTACLHDGRYRVRVTWLAGNGRTGAATAASSATEDSGLFWFFDPDNWEVLIKVLDGCALNDHVWVYGASTTDLGYTVRVTDTATGLEREYRNEPGVPASAITDATAFPDGCRPP